MAVARSSPRQHGSARRMKLTTWYRKLTVLTPNPSFEPTRCGRRRLAATGHVVNCPSAASRHLPTRAAQFER